MPHAAMPTESLVEALEPEILWRHLWQGSFDARGKKYDLHVCRIADGGQLRIYVFRGDEFLAYQFDPAHDATCAPGSDMESANVEDLICSATSDIGTNEHGFY